MEPPQDHAILANFIFLCLSAVIYTVCIYYALRNRKTKLDNRHDKVKVACYRWAVFAAIM
jgi:hypothetical protein